ncbi:MAG: ORF6N domain-containing protein [Selenomonadaceae bacterium]|nr:ORF6N domain-containing protein [Selenomonadaceae bacterium]
MDIKTLIPLDWQNQRVITSAQLAKVYGTTPARIKDNFHHAKKNFIEGEHYFKLSGEELKEFKESASEVLFSYRQADPSSFIKATSNLMLWTHKGCVRHCKMLNTPEAWKMFDELERVYFGVLNGELAEQTDDEPVDRTEISEILKRLAKLEAELDGTTEAYDAIIKEMQKNLSPAERAATLVALSLLMTPSPERQKIILTAANLIAGKNIF